MKKTKFIFIFICFLFLINIFNNVTVIKADTQIWENEYGKLEVYPTIDTNDILHKQYFNATSYLSSQDLDIAFKFNVSLSYGGIYYWDGTNYNKLKNIQHIVYNGKHWYFLKNIYFEQYETKHGYWEYVTPINTSGKWDMFIKRSCDSLPYAIENNLYVELCPYWNSSFKYFKHGEFINKKQNYQTMINVTKYSGGDVDCEGHCNSNFSDLRFVYADNISLIPYAIEDIHNDNWCHVWLNNTLNLTDFNMYYGKTNCKTTSNPYVCFDFYTNASNTSDWYISIPADMVIEPCITSEGNTSKFYQPQKITTTYATLSIPTFSGSKTYEYKFKSSALGSGIDQNTFLFMSGTSAGFRTWVRIVYNYDGAYIRDGGSNIQIYNGLDNNISFYVFRMDSDTDTDKVSYYLYSNHYTSLLGSQLNKNFETSVSYIDSIRINDGSNAGNYGYRIFYSYMRVRDYHSTPQTVGNWGSEIEYPPSCLIWYNYTDENITLNIWFNTCLNTTGGTYMINETNWLSLLYGVVTWNSVQFGIIVQLIIFAVMLWLSFKTKDMEGKGGKKLHKIPFIGGIYLLFAGIDFLTLTYTLTAYVSELVLLNLTWFGILLCLLGIIKAFFYSD